MKKIKAVCYTHELMGVMAYQSHTPAKEMTDRYGIKHYSCYISISDKDYNKLKGFIEKMDKGKKLARKNRRTHQFKFVKA